jgi:hypothetical protein
VPTFADRESDVISAAYTYGNILDFLDLSRYVFFQETHEAECTPFQTHYFSENLVALGIEPEPLDL